MRIKHYYIIDNRCSVRGAIGESGMIVSTIWPSFAHNDRQNVGRQRLIARMVHETWIAIVSACTCSQACVLCVHLSAKR